jgi:hypothetical protein
MNCHDFVFIVGAVPAATGLRLESPVERFSISPIRCFSVLEMQLDPGVLAVFETRKLKNALALLFQIQSAARLEIRSDHSLTAQFRAVPYPLVDGDTNLPPHLVLGDSILNFRATFAAQSTWRMPTCSAKVVQRATSAG